MSIKPILFNTDMVRAILDGRKTVTRRAVKPKYRKDEGGFQVCWKKSDPSVKWVEKTDEDEGSFDPPRYVNPPYQTGDVLWVRETWSTTDACGLFPPWPSTGAHYIYKAELEAGHPYEAEARWFPSIHMPRAAARVFLRVNDVRVERLKEIKNGWQFDKEGIVFEHGFISEAWRDFQKLWDSTLKPADLPLYSWDANPWVWVIEFERCEKPEGWLT